LRNKPKLKALTATTTSKSVIKPGAKDVEIMVAEAHDDTRGFVIKQEYYIHVNPLKVVFWGW
jgi:hypothetical protein